MTQDRLVTELKAEGLWNYVETLQPLGMEGVKMLLMQDYVRPPPPYDDQPRLIYGVVNCVHLSLRKQRRLLVQAKFGVLDMEDKQRLFRLIRRLTSEDSGKPVSGAAQPEEKRRASAARPAGEVYNHGGVTPNLLDKELLDNNNLLDLDELDGSGDLLSAVRPMHR